MSDTIIIGKRHIALEHIALVQPFDPTATHRMKTDRTFQTRIVLIDRESVLSEERVAYFTEGHGFRLLEDDQVAVNPVIRFRVESFVPDEDFKPNKPFQSRLVWRDEHDGNTQSILLLSPPEKVLAVAVRGEHADRELDQSAPPTPKGQQRRKRRGQQAEPEPA